MYEQMAKFCIFLTCFQPLISGWLPKQTELVQNIYLATTAISKAINILDIFHAHELLKSIKGFHKKLNMFLESRFIVVQIQLLAQKVSVNYRLSEIRSIWPGTDHFVHPVYCSYFSIHH